MISGHIFEFYILLTISIAMVAISFVQLIKSRFLHPRDLAILSTFYYAVPLSVAGFFIYNPRQVVFLHAQAANPAYAFLSLKYAVAAMLALYVGSWGGKLLGEPRLGTYFKLDEGGLPRVWIALAVFVAIIGLGVMQFGLTDFMAGYATEANQEEATALGLALVYFATGSLGLVVVYAVLLNRFLHRRQLWMLIGAAFAVAILVLLIRGKRLEIVTTFLPLAIVLLAARRRMKIVAWRAVVGGLGLMGLVAIAMTRLDDTGVGRFDLFQFNFYVLSEGLYAGHALPGIIHRLETGMIGYEYGIRFVNGLLGFIPRFVWPLKDDFVYAGNLALEGVAPLGASTFLSEVVLQGGMIAVLLVHLTLGFVFERVNRFQAVWDMAIASGRIPGRFIAYIVLTAIFIPHFRDGIVPAVKLSLQAGAVFLVLVRLHLTPVHLLLPSVRSRQQPSTARG